MLTGGELLLRPDWLPIAQRARHLGFALRLFTNGSLIDEHSAAAMEALNAVVEISLHAMRADVFEKITGRPGSLKKTLSGIARLRRRGVEVVIKTPLQLANRKELPAVAAYAAEIGATHQAYGNILPRKDGDLYGPSSYAGERAEVIESLLLEKKETGK